MLFIKEKSSNTEKKQKKESLLELNYSEVPAVKILVTITKYLLLYIYT